MANTTIEEKVVREAPDVNPIEGYAVVVFEQIGEGREFRAVLRPGERLQRKKGWWRLPAIEYVAFAVNEDKNLRLKFTHRVTHRGQINDFDLEFTVNYNVTDPRKIAEHLNSDPLKRLQNEISQAVERIVYQADWSWIEDRFEQVEQEILDDEGEVMEHVRKFASDLGINLQAITVRRWLDDEDLKPRTAKKKAEVEKATLQIEHEQLLHRKKLEEEEEERRLKREHNRKLLDELDNRELRETRIAIEKGIRHQEHELETQEEIHKLKLMYQRKMLEAFTTGVDTLAEETGNADDFVRNAQAVMRTINGVFNKGGLLGEGTIEGNSSMSEIGVGSNANKLLPASASPAARLLTEVLGQLEQLSCPPAQKNTLLSAMLHLLAELLLGDEAKEEEIEAYGGRVKDVTIELKQFLSPEQFKLMRRFYDYESLKEYLK